MRVLIVIPARGGSKGLPGKNLHRVGGVSLVGRAVYAAREFAQALTHDVTILVDTDAQDIADEGRAWGAEVPFLRPAELAGDTTPTADSVLHAAARLAEQGFAADIIVLLQPTSPLRTADDIARCWAAFDPASAPSVISTVPAEHPPEIALRASADGVVSWASGDNSTDVRRQAFAPVVYPSGAVYVITRALLEQHRRFIVAGVTRAIALPAARSIDIDTAADLAVASALAAAAPVKGFTLGGFEFRRDRCFIIAEAGVNHNGDVALAHKLVDVAADAGVDCVKFQTFEPTLLVSAAARKAAYQVVNTGEDGDQMAMLQSLVLPPAAHQEIMDHARERGIVFLSTPFDERSADLLEELGVPAFKIPSGEITNHRLLRHLARKGRPLLMSSGMATMAEMASAVLTIRETSDVPLALFHCVTNYPASPDDCNLRAMDSMRSLFGVPVGWSDHTMGLDISLAAVAQGAEVIEKHFTLDRDMEGPDHKASLEPDELAALVRAIRDISSAMGDGIKRPTAAELAIIPAARKSLHSTRDLAPGDVITSADLIPLRPGTGMSPALEPVVVGRRVVRAVAGGTLLSPTDLE